MRSFSCFEKPRYISLALVSVSFSFLSMTSIEGRETMRATKYMQFSFCIRADSMARVEVSMAFARGTDWLGAGQEST